MRVLLAVLFLLFLTVLCFPLLFSKAGRKFSKKVEDTINKLRKDDF